MGIKRYIREKTARAKEAQQAKQAPRVATEYYSLVHYDVVSAAMQDRHHHYSLTTFCIITEPSQPSNKQQI